MGSPTSDSFDNWTVQVRKGVLELCILNALEDRERYGYELVKTLAALPGFGVTEGTLYPLLSRLRAQGLVKTRLEESTEGPARKYYSLSTSGRAGVGAMNDYLSALISASRELRKK
jgi:PadR family transcriptional regulator, regulatory protein PadR